MSTTVPQLAADMSQAMAETLIEVARATPTDKLSWEPMENGRSILDQLTECCLANRKWANILRTHAYANLPKEVVERTVEGLDSAESVATRLREATAELAAALHSMPVEDLDKTIETEWGPYTLARGCFHAYWNMAYHHGQISYIQTLYGDFADHESWPVWTGESKA